MDSQIPQLVTQALFVIICVSTIARWLHKRDLPRFEVAAMFTSVAASVVVSLVTRLSGWSAPWLSTLASLGVLAQPYLLLRLVEHFRPVPRIQHVSGLIGMVGSWGILLVGGTSISPALALLLVFFFVYVEGYATFAFIRAAFATQGIVQRRLVAVAAGSGFLASVLLLAGVALVARSAAGVVVPVALVLALGTAIAYYLGFVPPRWLIRNWQMAEFQRFVRGLSGDAHGDRQRAALDSLAPAAMRAAGGKAAVTLLGDSFSDRLVVHPDAGTPDTLIGEEAATMRLGDDTPFLREAWTGQRPSVIHRRPLVDAGLDRLVEAFGGAETVVLHPILAHGRIEGLVVLLLLRGALFLEEDLSLLALLCEQTALAIEDSRNYVELQSQNLALAVANGNLEAAFAELEGFSYSVSHDLRAPLRHISGFVALLERNSGEALNEQGRRYCQIISDSAHTMGKLIDDLLVFSRTGRSEMNKKPVGLDRLVCAVKEDLQLGAGDRQIDWIVEPLPDVFGDGPMLKQVFANLLGNAVKYTRTRELAQVQIGSSSDDQRVVVFVRDNGVGFDMAYQNKLFGVFQRLHDGDEFEGTGIGLATVRRIVQRHGGEVWAEGAPDAGATFYFSLPQLTERQEQRA